MQYRQQTLTNLIQEAITPNKTSICVECGNIIALYGNDTTVCGECVLKNTIYLTQTPDQEQP